jgi:hypothetical protein
MRTQSVMRAKMPITVRIKSHLEARPHQMLEDNLRLVRLADKIKVQKKLLLKRMMMMI